MKSRLLTLLIGSAAVLAMLSGPATASPVADIDDEGPGLAPNDPIVRVGDAVVQEVDGFITFTVSLNKAATENTSVDIAVSHGTSNASDFTGPSQGTVTFIAGSTGGSATFGLDVDDGVEPAEHFTVVLSNADEIIIGDGVGAGTILDGDGPVLDIADAEIAEGGGALSFTVTASYAPQSDVAFDFRTGTLGFEAEPDVDFTPVDAAGVLSAGSTEATLTVPVVDDDEIEDDELVIAFVEQASAGSISDGTALGRILDDDGALPPTDAGAEPDAAVTPGTVTPDPGFDIGTGEQASGFTVEPASTSNSSSGSIGLLLVIAGLSIMALSWLVARRIRENEADRRMDASDPTLNVPMHG